MALPETAFPILNGVPGVTPDFDGTLEKTGCGTLVREETTTLQINVGKLCNQACHHCRLKAGPKRTEIMRREVAERVLEMLAASPSITTVDITGGAPELNANFELLVRESGKLGRHVIASAQNTSPERLASSANLSPSKASTFSRINSSLKRRARVPSVS